MKTNLLKWSALILVIMTSITVFSRSRDWGQPFIMPFSCDRALVWDDEIRLCNFPTPQSSQLPPVVGLITFTQLSDVMGVCRESSWDDCTVPISGNHSITLSGASRTLYF